MYILVREEDLPIEAVEVVFACVGQEVAKYLPVKRNLEYYVCNT